MNMKKTGLTASGKPRPEFKRGDIYRDQYGGTVMIKGVAGRCVTYRRKGYEYDCVMPVCQFRRDFSLVQAVPRRSPTSNNKAKAHVKAMKKTISRGKK